MYLCDRAAALVEKAQFDVVCVTHFSHTCVFDVIKHELLIKKDKKFGPRSNPFKAKWGKEFIIIIYR